MAEESRGSSIFQKRSLSRIDMRVSDRVKLIFFIESRLMFFLPRLGKTRSIPLSFTHPQPEWSLLLKATGNGYIRRYLVWMIKNSSPLISISSFPGGVGGTVASESALRSAATLLSRIRAPPPVTGLAEGLKA
ncbi:hypothetical protein PoB_000597300 [Plakobranchus ocellatus]|uniref:Uncharacterized protein n=1 Tax=Plakobranchus ocellatus TaxID=259542 RepID=A0AAV3YAH8_9GAST|nr:hypothetical protein PoB_000597300 [Plakobranchus ocellatus]